MCPGSHCNTTFNDMTPSGSSPCTGGITIASNDAKLRCPACKKSFITKQPRCPICKKDLESTAGGEDGLEAFAYSGDGPELDTCQDPSDGGSGAPVSGQRIAQCGYCKTWFDADEGPCPWCVYK